MRSHVALVVLLVGVGLPARAVAQDPSGAPSRGAEKGDWEVMLAAVGNSTNDLKDHGYGFTGSVGNYVYERWVAGLRQSVTFTAVDGGGDDDVLFGSTRVFCDRVFAFDWFRPSLGITLGGTYGSGVPDSFAIGPDTTLRVYADRKTFAFLAAEYQFLTSENDRWQDFIDNGNLELSLGIGVDF